MLIDGTHRAWSWLGKKRRRPLRLGVVIVRNLAQRWPLLEMDGLLKELRS